MACFSSSGVTILALGKARGRLSRLLTTTTAVPSRGTRVRGARMVVDDAPACLRKTAEKRTSENQNYRQSGLLCTPRNFAHSLKFLRKKIFFGTKVTSEKFLKHIPKFECHRSSGRHTNETSNLLTKLWSFKVIWTFFSGLVQGFAAFQ